MVAPGGGRRADWLADLEEVADLAAETVAPQQVGTARRRRSGYSAARVAALLTGAPVEDGAAAPPAGPRPVPERRSPARRRLLAPTLALLGTGAICAGVLLRLPGPDPATPLSGPAYSTPSPSVGSAPLQPALIDPASPVPPPVSPSPTPTDAPPAAAAPRPAAGGAPRGAVPAVAGPITAGPPGRTSSPAVPMTAPTATAAPSPTAVPATAPTSTPGAGLAVRSVSLSMGTCEDRGTAWVCPETATFTLAPGAHGTLTFSIAGTAITCSGASSAFDQAQPAVDIPAGTTSATVSAALVFPAASHPAASAPGHPSSTATVSVTSPNRVASASQPFGGASCP